ncbi:hypothetical protein BV25DRAFT_1829129 [Artomyces pyxidatus]|uniref:Uncharacterized protein n=1 Tax=Artomyces pyxidatus TaxID=48021 RepID=A0ACB8STR2_9AGAM|nr:hypothetical protein BV25DRAFT_1829129 [Artomyces pyxidatus]
MSFKTPATLPPAASFTASPSPSIASSIFTSRGSMSTVSTAPTSPERGQTQSKEASPQKDPTHPLTRRNLTIPAVALDAPTISDDMAASMAVSLLGHVLFLKSQVPFPVMQLARMPNGPSSKSKAARKRMELINAFDELSSHLHTTFSALATALARNKARYPSLHSEDKPESAVAPLATAYLAFVLGPTIGAPKSRVVLAVEGLEVKIWGARDDVGNRRVSENPARDTVVDEEAEEGEHDDAQDEEEDESEADESASEDEENEGFESEEIDSEMEEEGTDAADMPPDSPPPSEPSTSRSPSPSPAILRGRPALSPKPSPPHSPAPPSQRTQTHAEAQQILRAAERLLSRKLADAYAEGGGMACELAPTQTHVLLRAPRRFAHPAWLPRQNVTSSLDGMLADFLRESGLRSDGAPPSRRRGVKTEGVVVGCAGVAPDDEATGGEEEDDMIWWAWDGRLSGFADW